MGIEINKEIVLELIKRLKSTTQQTRLNALAEKIGPQEIHDTTLGEFSTKVNPKNTGETAAQRAIFAKNARISFSNKKTTKIKWIDIELPIVFNNKSRRRCIDIIGKGGGNSYLVELKYDPNGDSPIYATLELLCYFLIIKGNHDKLKNVHHKDIKSFDWQSFGNNETVLSVAANEEYWKKYLNKSAYSLEKSKDFFRELKEKYQLNIKFFSFANLSSKPGDSKNATEYYTPKLENNNWTEIPMP